MSKEQINENDITEQMLDFYIEECRKELGDDFDLGNLITFNLEQIKKGNIEEGRKGMLRWYKSELARSKKLLCGKCGKMMAQYYEAKCYHCMTPEEIRDENGVYNLYEASMIVTLREEDFVENEFIDSVIEYFGGNDSYAKLHFNEKDTNHKLMLKYFPNDKIWLISW